MSSELAILAASVTPHSLPPPCEVSLPYEISSLTINGLTVNEFLGIFSRCLEASKKCKEGGNATECVAILQKSKEELLRKIDSNVQFIKFIENDHFIDSDIFKEYILRLEEQISKIEQSRSEDVYVTFERRNIFEVFKIVLPPEDKIKLIVEKISELSNPESNIVYKTILVSGLPYVPSTSLFSSQKRKLEYKGLPFIYFKLRCRKDDGIYNKKQNESLGTFSCLIDVDSDEMNGVEIVCLKSLVFAKEIEFLKAYLLEFDEAWEKYKRDRASSLLKAQLKLEKMNRELLGITEELHAFEKEQTRLESRIQDRISALSPAMQEFRSFMERVDESVRGQFSCPEEYLCPITKLPMRSPVKHSCGKTFEAAALTRYMDFKPGVKCPSCRSILISSHLKSDDELQQKIDAWVRGQLTKKEEVAP